MSNSITTDEEIPSSPTGAETTEESNIKKDKREKLRIDPKAIYTVEWFPKHFPHEDEIVTVEISSIDALGIWVSLLEYGSKGGMIPSSKYTERGTRNIPKSVKVGKVDIAKIASVDEESQSMDLTRQALTASKMADEKRRYKTALDFMSILNYISTEFKMPLAELVTNVAYPLYDEESDYQGYRAKLMDQKFINTLNIPEAVKEKLITTVQIASEPVETRVHANFEAEVFGPGGVDALRESLSCGYEAAPEDKDLQISIIAPPEYLIATTSIGPEPGVEKLKKVLARIEEKIKSYGGNYRLRSAPSAVTQSDARKLQEHLDELQAANTEVDIDSLE